MYRIYFDTNVFTILRHDQAFAGFAGKLISRKDSLLFFFSPAHIDDLSRDLTDEKYSDLEFIHRLVDDNYVCEDFFKKNCGLLLATPVEAYRKKNQPQASQESSIDIGTIRLLRGLPEMKEYSLIFDTVEALHAAVQNPRENVVVSNLPDNPSDEVADYFRLMGLTNKLYTPDEWLDVTKNITSLINSDRAFFRMSRRLTKQDILAEKHGATIRSNNYDHNLRLTKIGKTFTETVQAVVETLKKIPGFDSFFIEYGMSYMLLNILGMDTEKNRGVEFQSVQSDSQHSYYGMRMDYVVSNDKGFRSKSKALYNLYSVEAKVLSLDEFIRECPLPEGQSETLHTFLDLLEYDLSNGLLINSRDSITSAAKQQQFKLMHRYFSYFNMMEVCSADRLTIIYLWNNRRNVDDFVSYREVTSVLRKCYAAFGVDDDNKGDVTVADCNEMRLPGWRARKWSFGKLIIELKYLDESSKYVLQVTWKRNSVHIPFEFQNVSL